MSNYDVYTGHKYPIKAWTRGVPVEPDAIKQVQNLTALPFIHKHIALMPDVHVGMGSTIGSVIPTKNAIIPAAVGVDIGCGMMAIQTSLIASDLPDSLRELRSDIERAVPTGFNSIEGRSTKGNFIVLPNSNGNRWRSLEDRYAKIVEKHSKIQHKQPHLQMGTLGGGNHFIEICLDTDDKVWVMLHSGSRGAGNIIGRYFTELAKHDMRIHHINLPDDNLAYLSEGTTYFDDYVEALMWAQDYASENRKSMMESVLRIMRTHFKPFTTDKHAINCHHNYAEVENHFGKNVWITRKGAVRAREGDLGIIPGSMGAKSFIVKGLGNKESFCSCSHGAGRVMSRTKAKELVSIEDHIFDTSGVECRKDESVIDESPRAYKNIDDVMAAQADLVSIEATLKQVLCVKG